MSDMRLSCRDSDFSEDGTKINSRQAKQPLAKVEGRGESQYHNAVAYGCALETQCSRGNDTLVRLLVLLSGPSKQLVIMAHHFVALNHISTLFQRAAIRYRVMVLTHKSVVSFLKL
jgi:hypothetical protein